MDVELRSHGGEKKVYEQVDTLLQHACTFHRDVRRYYGRLSRRITQERSKMLLSSMTEGENRLAQALVEYMNEAPQNVLKTWCSLSNEKEVLLETPYPDVDPSASIDDLVHLGLELDNRLMAIFGELADRSEPEEVRSLFQNLLEQEQQEERQFAMQAMRCMDL